MDDELVTSDQDPLSASSMSSLLPHCSAEELLQNTEELTSQPSQTGIRNGRARKLLQKYKLVIPELGIRPSSQQENEQIDLSDQIQDAVDPWLTEKFPGMRKRAMPLQCLVDRSRNGVSAQQRVKQELLAKIAVRRKIEQQKRRDLYTEDNGDILGNSDEDEHEGVVEKKTKTKLKDPKPVDSDKSEDDDDYVAETDHDSVDGDESDMDEETAAEVESEGEEHTQEEEQQEEELIIPSLQESENIFGSQSPAVSVEPLFTQPHNVFSLPENGSNAVPGSSQFPVSLSQWYSQGSQKRRSSIESLSDEEVIDELNKSGVNEPIKNDDLLMFCSGQFDPPAKSVDPSTAVKPLAPAEEEEDDEIPVRPTQKKKHLVSSDDEEKIGEPESSIEPLEKDDEVAVDEATSTRRAVLISDDEDEEDELADEGEEECGDDEEEEMEEDQDIEKEEDAGKDSDDELAVIRRLENKHHKNKLRKKKFFDDEASLSGSDVGSYLDEEEEGMNEYEADECDNEEFDEDDIRNKNHKLYLKQQQQQVHREIAKLQDRLLADGDLAGVETNRTFRVRLREDVEVNMAEVNDFSQDTLPDDDNPEEERKRADALKFKAEMHSVLSQVDVSPMDDDIERAAQAALLTETEDLFDYQESPSLIGRTPLANAFKDMNGSNATKQMYTTTTAPATSSSAKRSAEGAFLGQPKKQKLTLFDTLDD